MFPKILCTLVLLPLLEANTSWIQDPTKVESTHYKLAFENERVQVVNIHYGPHEKSALHQHPAGVVVNVTNGHLKFTDQKGVAQEVHAIHGEARWFPALKHTVENLSDTSYDGVYVGVKGVSTAVSSPGEPLLTPGGLADDGQAEKILLSLLLADATPQAGQQHQELRSALPLKTAPRPKADSRSRAR
jgi:quercetin dioxygenase-like cupin family protein